MPLRQHLKCTCDKCNREQIFESWDAAKTSAWRDVRLDVIGGAGYLSEDKYPPSLRAVLCGDCVGGLGIKAAPAPELVEA